jgi:hypothetical protein
MRASALLFLAATLLATNPGMADPASSQQASAASAPATPVPSAAVSPPSHSSTVERVVVHGTPPDDNVADKLNEIVCHSEPPQTGSRIGASQECLTVRQWNDRKKQSQGILDGAQLRSLSSGYGR